MTSAAASATTARRRGRAAAGPRGAASRIADTLRIGSSPGDEGSESGSGQDQDGEDGEIARRNGVLVLMSVELMLNAVNLNLIAFSAKLQGTGNAAGVVSGQVFALFVITIAAAEVGVGLAIVLLIYRNLHSPDLDRIDQLKG